MSEPPNRAARARNVRPLVDVGIPTFGRPSYVAQAIESVLGQTEEAWTLTVTEDGVASPDIAAAVEPYLSDPRVRFLAGRTHLGAARNLTRSVATGTAPYIALLHDDDCWQPGFLERRTSFLTRHPQSGFVFSPVAVIDAEGREVERTPVVLSEGEHPSEQIIRQLLENNIVPSPSVVMRRSAFEEVGGSFDDSFRRIYDYELWLRLAVHFPVGYVTSIDAAWRVHEHQSTRSVDDRRTEFLRLIGQTDALVRSKLPSCRQSERQRRRTFASWLLTNALDALVLARSDVALADYGAALRAYPPALVDTRSGALIAGLLLGRFGRTSIARLRSIARRRRLNLHPTRIRRR